MPTHGSVLVLSAAVKRLSRDQSGVVSAKGRDYNAARSQTFNGMGLGMLSKTMLTPILDDDALTRGLGDPEARMLVEWLVDEAEMRSAKAGDDAQANREVRRLCRWARAVSRFVYLWCYEEAAAAAYQLAASEKFEWELPVGYVEPCELMHHILASPGEI